MDEDLDIRILRLARKLREMGASEVYVFGSAGDGQLPDDRDVDVAVSGLPRGSFFRAISAGWEILDRPLDLVDLDKPHPFTEYLKQSRELKRVG
ncbi:MAG: hypothetical protein ACP5HU_08475 [Phycisphaerae bacterium]